MTIVTIFNDIYRDKKLTRFSPQHTHNQKVIYTLTLCRKVNLSIDFLKWPYASAGFSKEGAWWRPKLSLLKSKTESLE